jgi:hypothetical protein
MDNLAKTFQNIPDTLKNNAKDSTDFFDANKLNDKLESEIKESNKNYFTNSKFGDDEGNLFYVEEIYDFVYSNSDKYYHKKYPLEKLKHNLEWWNKLYDIKNIDHKKRMMRANTSFPLLVVKEKNNLSVADGLNRLYKAIKIEKRDHLPIYLVPKKDIMKLAINTKKKESKEATGAAAAGGYSAPLFGGKVEAKEATTTASSGQYSTPAWVAPNSKQWRGRSKPQIPGGKFVTIKGKCQKFPYCNQGDIKALKITENEVLELSRKLSKEFGISESIVRKLVINNYNNL